MTPSEPTSLIKHFATLKDPGIVKKNRHNLLDIIAISIYATICGTDCWVSIAEFDKASTNTGSSGCFYCS